MTMISPALHYSVIDDILGAYEEMEMRARGAGGRVDLGEVESENRPARSLAIKPPDSGWGAG